MQKNNYPAPIKDKRLQNKNLHIPKIAQDYAKSQSLLCKYCIELDSILSAIASENETKQISNLAHPCKVEGVV